MPLPMITIVPASLACGLAVVLQVVALYGARKWRGTTLMMPCLWVATSAAALAVTAVIEIVWPNAEGIGMSAIRFAAYASTLCPIVAVLGAKRPQDRGWQWVVLTLWLVMVWPAVQALANPAGPRVELAPLWKMFVVGVIALGPLNYITTRNAKASLLTVVGQVILFLEVLGFAALSDWHLPMALTCFLLAAVTVFVRREKTVQESKSLSKNPSPSPSPEYRGGGFQMGSNINTNDQQTARWLKFRNCYGAFWGIRILQRVNETAGLRGWPVQLTWHGFERNGDQSPDAVQEAEIEQTLDTLLRRFF
jgi:hypothetical protein